MNAERIGRILAAHEACSNADVDRALEVQAGYGGRLGTILVNMGIITEEQLLQALAEQFELEYRPGVGETDVLPVDLNPATLREQLAFPVAEHNGTLEVLTDDPLKLEIFGLLEQVTGKTVRVVLTREENLKQLAALLESEEEVVAGQARIDIDAEVDRLKELASEAPVIKLVNNLLSKAVERGASDIHFEAMRKAMKVRLRVDGTLQTVETVPQNLEPAVIARLKLIANMNIAENRLPQDGRIGVRIAGQEMDIRASSVPTQFGESFVVRLLGREAIDYAVENLGLYPDHCEGIRRIVRHPNGIFLTTGPTGSGKTTTLYSMLTEVSTDENKVVTVENPVEYELPSANQINIRPEIDYTFSNALRSILRQDPDIIMVGEIRDLETAEIAVQASLTGHLVLSTLHTNSALDAIPRLLDMGMEFYLLKACICGLMAQRLVRKLCSHCRVMAGIPPEAERLYGLDALAGQYPFVPVAPQTAPGCERCSGNGYRGRVVIAEVLPCDAKTLERIGDQGGADLHELGTRTMFEDGLLKMLEGRTTLEDVLRASR